MSFFAFMMMLFALSRFTRRRRWRQHRRMYAWGWHSGDPFTHLQRGRFEGAGFQPAAQMPAPPPSPFEALKTRYVDGELSDAQYESALDALLKTPEGRSSMR